MKISHLITSAILGTAMVLGAGFAIKHNQEAYKAEAATTITLDATKDTSFPKDGITLTVSNGVLNNGTDYRVYKGATLTIESTVGDMTNIAFTFSGSNNGGWSFTSVQPNAATWTSPACTTGNSGKQARITQLVITIGGEAPQTINATVSEATAVIAGLSSGSTTTDEYCVTGYVTKIQSAYSPSFGNISFWMSDTKGGTNDLEAYRATCDATTAAKVLVGAKLKVTGNLQNYNGTTPEIVNGKNITILEEGTSVEEPTLVTGTLADLFANTAGNYKQKYQVTGYVTNWYGDNTDGTEYGNFYLADTENGSPEYLIWGATSKSDALVWDGGAGSYQFTNPKDFLTATLTKKIAIGSQVTMLLTRADHTESGVTTPEAKGIVTAATGGNVEPTELGTTLLIEPSYLDINDTSSTNNPIIEETTLTATDNREYVTAPGGNNKVYAFKPNTIGTNAFDSEKKVVLMGKTGAYLYNTTAYSKKISSLELFAPTGASASVSVAVEFATATDGPITDSISSSTNSQQLSTLNHVYDFTKAGMLSADYRYFRIEVLNNYNAQLQIRVTFAEEGQQVVNLNSITLSSYDLVDGVLTLPVGTNTVVNVTYDPENASDKTITWTSSDESVATVRNGMVFVAADATVGATATITATPTDTHAQAKSFTVKADTPAVKAVTMRNGLNNSKDNRLQFVAGSSLVWPAGAIIVTLTDNSTFTDADTAYDHSLAQWYYSNSDDGTNDVLIEDLSTFTFALGMKRMRLVYDGVSASARTYITVVESASTEAVEFAELFLDLLSTGTSPVCVVTPAGVVQTDLSDLREAWVMLAEEFEDLGDTDKDLFAHGVANENGDTIQKALALYDFIATKYNTQLETVSLTNYNFMGRTITPATNVIRPLVNNNTVTVVVVLTSVALVSVSLIGVYFLLRKKKEKR